MQDHYWSKTDITSQNQKHYFSYCKTTNKQSTPSKLSEEKQKLLFKIKTHI